MNYYTMVTIFQEQGGMPNSPPPPPGQDPRFSMMHPGEEAWFNMPPQHRFDPQFNTTGRMLKKGSKTMKVQNVKAMVESHFTTANLLVYF